MAKWNIPDNSASIHIRYYANDGTPVLSENVCFVPDQDIDCSPPYKKGVQDGCWVTYRQGSRPTTKEGWESIVGMRLQTMI